MLASIRRSLRAKVVTVVLITTLAALLIATGAVLVYEIDNYQQFLLDDAATQAEILARSNAPALAFDDPDAAAANLALLESRDNFAAAAIYRENGQLFASYRRGGETANLPDTVSDGAPRVVGGSLEVFRPIVENDLRLGTVYLRATYDLADRLWDYVLILVAVLVVSLVAAGALSLSLAGSVTEPVLAVTRVARQVIERRDFALRAGKTTQDEIGVLVDAFNSMLFEVDERAAALEASNRMLQQETEERRNAEAALRAADRRKDEFLATLAHELRNPLAPMVNALGLLNVHDIGQATALRAREILSRQVRQLIRLVDDLLDVSRITSGKLAIRREAVELTALIENAADSVRPAIDSRDLELVLDLPPPPVDMLADPIRLSQVLSNLLHNAVKYSEPGGRISLTARILGGTARIEIADAGVGISAEALPGIFEMFSQGDSPADGEGAQTGLGVGLTLAQRLVELHGGTIEAKSRGRGLGSTFTIELPFAAPAAQPVPSVERPADSSTPSQRILLVDDNVDFAASLALLLQGQGHTVRIAHEARTAVEVAREFRPDFGFLDLGLPDVSGYTLARRLREQPETARTVLVAVSGWGQPEDRRRSKEAGFAMHLVKPVDLEDIESALCAAERT